MAEAEKIVSEEAQKNFSAEEFEAAFQGAAPFANKTMITMTPFTGRLSFLEIAEGKPYFRSAVTMSVGDLMALKALLDRLLENVQVIDPMQQQQGADLAPKE